MILYGWLWITAAAGYKKRRLYLTGHGTLEIELNIYLVDMGFKIWYFVDTIMDMIHDNVRTIMDMGHEK